MPIGKCRSCESNSKLSESHIIPKFVYKWLKTDTDGGVLRFGDNPSKPRQDGIKDNLLCQKCENLFNTWETPTSAKVFHPLVRDQMLQIPYEDWFLKFCVSVSWRILMIHIEKKMLPPLSVTQFEHLKKAFVIWREFLFGRGSHPKKFEQHFLPLGLIKDSGSISLPQNINRYIFMAVDMDVIADGDEIYTYAKLGPLLFIGVICTKDRKRWVNTKVHVQRGTIGAKRYTIPISVLNTIKLRAKWTLDNHDQMTEKQAKQSESAVTALLDKKPNSAAALAIKQDFLLFGAKVFESNSK